MFSLALSFLLSVSAVAGMTPQAQDWNRNLEGSRWIPAKLIADRDPVRVEQIPALANLDAVLSTLEKEFLRRDSRLLRHGLPATLANPAFNDRQTTIEFLDMLSDSSQVGARRRELYVEALGAVESRPATFKDWWRTGTEALGVGTAVGVINPMAGVLAGGVDLVLGINALPNGGISPDEATKFMRLLENTQLSAGPTLQRIQEMRSKVQSYDPEGRMGLLSKFDDTVGATFYSAFGYAPQSGPLLETPIRPTQLGSESHGERARRDRLPRSS